MTIRNNTRLLLCWPENGFWSEHTVIIESRNHETGAHNSTWSYTVHKPFVIINHHGAEAKINIMGFRAKFMEE